MTRIEIKEIVQAWSPQGFFNVFITHNTTGGADRAFPICAIQRDSLQYLVDTIAIEIDYDEECEILCESEELKGKITEMYDDLGRDEAELEGVGEEIKTRIYKIREHKEKIAQTGLITKEVIESHRELNT